MRYGMRKRIHTGHMGIHSCLRRFRTYLYWPNMSSKIRQFIETCPSFHNKQAPQPLYLHQIPCRPRQKLGIDIFTIKSRNYLITVDYYSSFFEVDFLPEMIWSMIISKLKSHIARYGNPDKIYSDNGPQLVSKEFKCFC